MKKSYSRSQTILEKFSLLTMAGVKLELGIVKAFTRWGTFCARHPLVVIAASVAVCIGLSVGIIWLKVRRWKRHHLSIHEQTPTTYRPLFSSHSV